MFGLVVLLAWGTVAVASEPLPVRLAAAGPAFETNATNVAKLLAAADTWVLPQPKRWRSRESPLT